MPLLPLPQQKSVRISCDSTAMPLLELEQFLPVALSYGYLPEDKPLEL
jgi:hypothetical protein